MMKQALLTIVATATLAGTAAAQAKFEYGKAEDLKEVKGTEWAAQAEAGAIFTTGNTETLTATAGLKASRKTGANKLEVTAAFAYIESGVRAAGDTNGNNIVEANEVSTTRLKTAETYEGKLRYDRFLGEKQSIFVALFGKRDVPAGKDYVVGGQLGYSRVLWKSGASEGVAEVGYDFSYEKLAAAPDALLIHSVRAFLGSKGKVSDDTNWYGSVEALGNVNGFTIVTRNNADAGIMEDLRINFVGGLATKLGKKLSAAFEFQAKYDAVPAPLVVNGLPAGVTLDPTLEASTLDTLFKASLIYTFM